MLSLRWILGFGLIALSGWLSWISCLQRVGSSDAGGDPKVLRSASVTSFSVAAVSRGRLSPGT